MLVTSLIGHIGGDAEVKAVDGREFTTFRVANSERWTDEAGQIHESTMWVDCVMSGKPNVLPYLKRGTQVYVSGSLKTRVYSSAKDRCMKAGLTISVRSLELLGGKADPVPGQVVDVNGTVHPVVKFYHAQSLVRGENEPEYIRLHNSRGSEEYIADRNGWITPYATNIEDNNGQNQDPIF